LLEAFVRCSHSLVIFQFLTFPATTTKNEASFVRIGSWVLKVKEAGRQALQDTHKIPRKGIANVHYRMRHF
jgi:hypothetical protein